MMEIERVLTPGGYCIFSSHNPVGTLLSPRGLLSPSVLKWRLWFLFFGFGRRYFLTPNQTYVYQCSPSKEIQRWRDCRLSRTRDHLRGGFLRN